MFALTHINLPTKIYFSVGRVDFLFTMNKTALFNQSQIGVSRLSKIRPSTPYYAPSGASDVQAASAKADLVSNNL